MSYSSNFADRLLADACAPEKVWVRLPDIDPWFDIV